MVHYGGPQCSVIYHLDSLIVILWSIALGQGLGFE